MQVITANFSCDAPIKIVDANKDRIYLQVNTPGSSIVYVGNSGVSVLNGFMVYQYAPLMLEGALSEIELYAVGGTASVLEVVK